MLTFTKTVDNVGLSSGVAFINLTVSKNTLSIGTSLLRTRAKQKTVDRMEPMKRLITGIMFLLLCCSCTIFSPQTELFKEVDEPAELDRIELLLYKKDFFTTGWICADKAGWPFIVHPFILTIFGCADVHWKDGHVYKCEVWYSMDWALEHELNHCKGWDDNSRPRQINESIRNY